MQKRQLSVEPNQGYPAWLSVGGVGSISSRQQKFSDQYYVKTPGDQIQSLYSIGFGVSAEVKWPEREDDG